MLSLATFFMGACVGFLVSLMFPPKVSTEPAYWDGWRAGTHRMFFILRPDATEAEYREQMR